MTIFNIRENLSFERPEQVSEYIKQAFEEDRKVLILAGLDVEVIHVPRVDKLAEAKRAALNAHLSRIYNAGDGNATK